MGRLRDDLEREWAAVATGAGADRALRRWQASEPSLAGVRSLDELVATANQPGDETASEVLRPLLRLSGVDPLARRCLLQALLPGLVRLCGRHPSAGEDADERLAQVLTLALERIRELAGTNVAYPAAAVAWRVGDRLRRAEAVSRRSPVVPLGELGRAAPAPRPPRSASEDLTALLVDGVRRGTVRQRDAALIYTTRVVGVPCHVLAADRGIDPTVLRTRRRRAERHLATLADDWC
ncbi:MAG: hypothetical protein AB1679_24545 [Actinomycetota bacterium]